MSLKTKEDRDYIINKESSTIAKNRLLDCTHSALNVFGFIALQDEI
jgi:hypothetical protein